MEEKNAVPTGSPSASIETGGPVVVENAGLKRKLKARHIQMIAIGSNVGTGLFIGSGAALHRGGPASLVSAFLLISISLFIMMQSLGEMTVLFPVSGSFTRYATRFIDPALGFAMGWQYWLCWVSVFAAEATAANILIQYWTSSVHTAVWISLFIVINLCIHCFSVKIFGEVEFVVSTLKVISIVVFIVVIWVVMAGGGPDGQKHGGEYWVDPGALANGFKGLASVFVTAAFACGGTEVVGIVSGEAKHPRYNIPRAIRTLMWRMIIFYVVSLLFVTFVVPSNHGDLLGGKNAGSSPFVIAIKSAGIKVLPDLLNAVVLICVCSVGSVSIYISSRVLVALAEDRMAWSVFVRTDREGRPYYALAFTSLIGSGICYLNVSSTGATVFGWFTSLSGMAFFLSWLVTIAANWRFRAAMKTQGEGDWVNRRFAFTAFLWPWASIFAFFAVSFMVVCQFYVSLFPIGGANPNAEVFFGGFIGVPIFLIMWGGYKLIYRTRLIPLAEVDLMTGRRGEDEEEIRMLERYENLPWGKKVLSYVRF